MANCSRCTQYIHTQHLEQCAAGYSEKNLICSDYLRKRREDEMDRSGSAVLYLDDRGLLKSVHGTISKRIGTKNFKGHKEITFLFRKRKWIATVYPFCEQRIPCRRIS